MNIPAVDLKSLLKRVSSVKGENLIFDVDGSVVVSDSDVTVRAYSPKITEGLGAAVSVNSRKFTSTVNHLSGMCDITLTANTLTLKSAKTKVDIEYTAPKLPVFQVAGITHRLPLQAVRDLLKYVAVAADPNKAALTGGVVQFDTVTTGLFDEESVAGFEAMGTDGRRCAFASIESVGTVAPFKFLVPLSAVAAMQTLDGDTFDIGESPSHYVIRSGGVTIHANKLSKSFPDFKSFLPKSFGFVASLDVAELKRVLYTVEPMVNPSEAHGVYVHFLDGRLNIKTVGAGGAAEDEMEYLADPLADLTEFRIKLNHKYLSDYLESVSGEVVFAANTPNTPVVLESGNRKLMMTAVTGGTQ